jgi:SAM-dependent methyltransferase
MDQQTRSLKKHKSLFGRVYYGVFPTIHWKLKKEGDGFDSVLDLGCGRGSAVQFLNVRRKVGVDMYEPYIRESREKGIHSEYVQADITKASFESASFELVFSSEVIEHLPKEEGFKLLAKAETWAKKKIILTTPNGFLEQKKYDNNDLQEHLSGWTADDFKKLGYRVYGFNGLKFIKGEEGKIKYHPYWMWRLISDISQKFVYFFPRLAFQLLAIKDIKSNNK